MNRILILIDFSIYFRGIVWFCSFLNYSIKRAFLPQEITYNAFSFLVWILWYNIIIMAKTITWEAEEYIVRDKTKWWYVGLVAVGLALSGIAIWIQSWTFLAVVVLSVVALIVYALRPPRILKYTLNNKGLIEDTREYNFDQFKAFGILNEGNHYAIVLTPRKRFSPRLTVYFPAAQGEEIVDAFGARLPMETVQLDMLDKLIKFLRI